MRLSGNGAVSTKETDMQINITGHHIDVTPALKAYVTDKLADLPALTT
jgi:hypothetical protein